MKYRKRPIRERFEKLYSKTGPCWLWKGQKEEYGSMKVGNRVDKAHRLAWYFQHGPVPDDAMVCHECDNPGCVNHHHLFLGSARDNQRDSVEKGRHIKGETNPRSTVSESEVRLMRHLYAGGAKQADLMQFFAIGQSCAYHIASEKTWKHIL